MKQTQSNQKNNASKVGTITNPINKIHQLSISILMMLLMSFLLQSCSDKNKKVTQSTTQANVSEQSKINAVVTSTQNYEIVPNKRVCMVNDRFMGVDQIPIVVSGIMYYGCCEDCIEKLQKNLNDVRFGSNPLNETKTDKASAVIVQDKSNGSVFYFDSKEDAKKFIQQNNS